MVNKSKIKGSNWERAIAQKFNEEFETDVWKRVPGSGALGTILGETSLVGDVKGRFDFLNRTFIIEAKTGYGGSKQLTLKKDWIDKIKSEASRSFGFGAMIGKFLGAKLGTKHFIVMDLYDFIEIMKEAEDNYSELQELYTKIGDKK